jgi:hypothetical protein
VLPNRWRFNVCSEQVFLLDFQCIWLVEMTPRVCGPVTSGGLRVSLLGLAFLGLAHGGIVGFLGSIVMLVVLLVHVLEEVDSRIGPFRWPTLVLEVLQLIIGMKYYVKTDSVRQ